MREGTDRNPADGLEAWRRAAERELGRPLAQGERLLYTARDALDPGFPGQPPYLRGPRASMYAGRPWTIRQYAGFSTAEASNAFFRRSLAAGQTGLSVAFDLPTHRGYDSDHPRVAGDVGVAGVAIDAVSDMERLFAGIPLDQVSVSMTMNGAVLPVMAAFLVCAERQGVPWDQLSGTIQNDILKEFMVRNTYIYPPGPSLRIVGDVIAYLSERVPRFHPISISGYHLQEAGAGAALELGLTLADGLAYVQTALERGLQVDRFAPKLSFFFAIGMDFLGEIAKLRAARLLWSELMERFAPADPASKVLRTHCQTSGWSLTAQDPLNNVVRTTIEALAAVLGGTQSLHTNSYDEAIGLPTERSARIARNTQLILREEAGLREVIDPLGGSFYLEARTREIARQAREVIAEVESQGGMVRAIELGWPQRQVESAAARRQARIDRGEERIVGMNAFRSEDAEPLEVFSVDSSAVLGEQRRRLEELRRDRDGEAASSALSALSAAAEGGGNLLGHSVAAMRAGATLGEVSAALERVFGRHVAEARASGGVYGAAYQGDADFAALRRRLVGFAEQRGRRPRVLVAKLGQDGHDRGAKVIAAGFADLGFDVDLAPLFQTPAEVAKQAAENDVHAIGISSLAGGHLTLLPQLRAELDRLGAEDILVILGGVIPDRDHPALREAGVSLIFGPGTPILQAAKELLDLLEEA